MKTNDIVQILKNSKYKNGSYIQICWVKDLTTEKGKALGIDAKKITSGAVRLGINYKNTKFAKSRAMIASDAPRKPMWYKRTDIKYIVEHNTNGNQYLQCFTSPNKMKTSILINNNTITKEEYETYVKLGYTQKQRHGEECCVMTIPVSNICQLGRYYEIIGLN